MWTTLKLIFTSKTKEFDLNLSPDFSIQVSQAIRLLGASEKSMEDKEVVQLLVDNGIGYVAAVEIMIFLPIAFVQNWLTTVNWLDTYTEYLSRKKQIVRKFSETKAYLIILEVTLDYFNNTPDNDTILKIAGRSAEFHAINQLLLDNPNAKIEDIKFTETLITRR